MYESEGLRCSAGVMGGSGGEESRGEVMRGFGGIVIDGLMRCMMVRWEIFFKGSVVFLLGLVVFMDLRLALSAFLFCLFIYSLQAHPKFSLCFTSLCFQNQ